MSASRWWLLAERVQATLPLLAVAGLAGFSWWLVQSSPRDGRPAVPPVASSAPDYQLDKARVVRFDAQGRPRAILDGTAMRHFPVSDRLVIDQLELSARDEETGQGLHAVAREGEADRRAELVHLRGGVKIVATPPQFAADAASDISSGKAFGTQVSPKAATKGGPVHFAGENVRIDTRQRIVSSDQPVLITQDHSQIQAQSLVYNDQTRIADIGGRVKGRYVATPRASTDTLK